MIKKIGLTGGIGSGKTTIARIIEAMGYPVFYSDLEAKNIVNKDPEVRKELIDLVGTQVYNENELDRAYLAEKIFEDPQLREKVNQIIHPRVRSAFDRFAEQNKSIGLAFNEAAILFETGAYRSFDANVLITAPEELRIARVINRDKVSEEQVRDRMKAQWPDDRKKQLADFIILNDDQTPVLAQVEKMMDQLISS